ncbi:MAG TPA: hypothetical protein VFV66_03935 [Nonomuraea sp.]|nr:hypothetical protein [Nonomuraea sp.]
MRRRTTCQTRAAMVLAVLVLGVAGCSAAGGAGVPDPVRVPPVKTSSARPCRLDPGATLPPTPPALPYGEGVRVVHYNTYPYRDGYQGVAAPAGGTVYAVGQREVPRTSGACGPYRRVTYALRWDGGHWRELPELDAVLDVRWVAGSDEGELWVFGSCRESAARAVPDGCMARWDGTSWTTSPLDGPRAEGVAVFGRDDIWTASLDAVHHWDGGRWQARPVPFQVHALHGTASGELWVAGVKGGQIALARWSGGSWTLMPRPPVPRLYPGLRQETYPITLAAGERGEVWVQGILGRTCGEEEAQCGRPVLARWSGGRWLVEVPPEKLFKEGVIRTIVSDGSGGVFAAVLEGVARFTGGKWTIHEAARGPLGGRTVTALAHAPGAAGTLWAVGQDDTEAEQTPFANGMIWRLG